MAKIKLDFTGVESYIKCAEGEHICVLKEVEEVKAKSSGADMLKCVFEVSKGSSTGAILYDNFVLTQKALWKLKGFLEIMGQKVADGKMSLDLSKLVGRACIVSVKYEMYEGKEQSRVDSYRKLELEPSGDEDDEDIDDEDDEEDDEPVETPKQKKARLAAEAEAKAKELAKKKAKKKPEPEPEDEDEEEEDDEEPAETPKQKKAREKAEAEAKAKKKPKKKPPVEEDEDEEWDEEDE